MRDQRKVPESGKLEADDTRLGFKWKWGSGHGAGRGAGDPLQSQVTEAQITIGDFRFECKAIEWGNESTEKGLEYAAELQIFMANVGHDSPGLSDFHKRYPTRIDAQIAAEDMIKRLYDTMGKLCKKIKLT